MSKRGSCADCNDCTCEESPRPKAQKARAQHYGDPRPRRDDSFLLGRDDKEQRPKPDPTPLNQPCPHYECGALRSQCRDCIVSWVLAVAPATAEAEAARFRQLRHNVAADRIRKAIQEHGRAA